ncbi:quinone oxidoreductase family protein [Chryseosolibacter indicus]|uniref:Zinc-binding alcohol dehydrogenase family protein n=1 Tax=Chryseosolibacter indicus TaxID=2782351 RepID=A0ABS5VUR9_9BACT|nr:zinc-binding alcohol dehydrogenase family protein [Chryseosolibacter indicus]MBT1705174.1 zinc-binding alcohol dehydrogenase family protein [Chryseosolibacter indicus]
MKALVMTPGGVAPQYVKNFPEPIAGSRDEVLISVKAASIKHLDKSRATGKHYSTKDDMQHAKVIGVDGIGLLEDGTRVYALGVTGMIAEKAIVEKSKLITVPEGLDDATAAALPNAVAGSVMALRISAGMKNGETVLINGATGFTGKMAVQIAKYYGARKVIVTGRNEKSLQSLLSLGADAIVPIRQDDKSFVEQIKKLHAETPIDVILDYLWGHTAELILGSLKGKGAFTHRTRFVSIGSLAGNEIQLSSEMLRSLNLQLSGSGLGSWTKDEMQKLIKEILPEMFQLAADNKLKVNTVTVNLQDIEKVWDMEVSDGKRLVVII